MSSAPIPLFETAADAIEQHSDLDRLAARGTLRLLLKEAGFDAKSILKDELLKVLEALLPAALDARGVTESRQVTDHATFAVRSATPEESGPETPERIFARLGS